MDWFKVSAAALAVMGGMSACAPAIVDPPTTGQAYLFEVSYVNFAWGLRWVGIVIEADGAIVAYEREEPWVPAQWESFTGEELAEKYAPNRRTIGHVPSDDLLERLARVGDIGDGYESPNLACADAGGVSYEAYAYDPAGGRYTPIVVRQEGDLIRQNTSGAGRELAEWLIAVAGETAIPELTGFQTSGVCLP